MKIDKENNGVYFNEEAHVYWDNESKYDSVTTIIGKFCHEFNSDFWSKYKALERLLSPADFAVEKKKLLDTKKVDIQYYVDMYNINETTLISTQQDILDEWTNTNAESCRRGTSLHAKLEQQYTKQKNCNFNKFGLGGKFRVCKFDEPLLEERGIYPEYLIHVKKGNLRIAGQIDLLIKDGNDIYIIDYKSNAEIKAKSFFDSKSKKYQMMKYPLSNIMDCNKEHYTLQLSMYAWMLQHNNPDLVIKKLVLIHYDHNDNVTEYEVDYLKSDVEKLCKYWEKQSVIERKKESRKLIEF